MLKKSFEIESVEQLKAISDPLRIKLLWEIIVEAKTGKMIAESLDMQAQKVHYHLKELEKVGLVYVERTEVKNGIVQKFYRPIASEIHVNRTFVSEDEEVDFQDSVEESFVGGARMTINALKETSTQFVHINHSDYLVTQSLEQLYLTKEQTAVLRKKEEEIQDLLKEFDATNGSIPNDDLVKYHLYRIAFPILPKGDE